MASSGSTDSNSHQHGGGHHAGMWVFPRSEQVTSDVAGKTFAMPSKYKLALGIAAILTALGVIGFVLRLTSDGFGSPGPWGYYVGIFSFIFMVTGAAPLVAAAFRFTKSHWRRPLSRVSELFALVGVVNVIIFIPLMLALPPILNPAASGDHLGTDLEVRRTLWFEVPLGAPHFWDLMGLVALAFCSVAILWLSAMPDMAQARAAGATGFRRAIYGLLAGRWYGTKRQWLTQKAGLAILGAFYFMMLVFVQFIFVTEYAMSMVPGWKDSVLPPMYTVMSFQTALRPDSGNPVRNAALGRLRRLYRDFSLLVGQQDTARPDPAVDLSPVCLFHHLLVWPAGVRAEHHSLRLIPSRIWCYSWATLCSALSRLS